MIIESIKLINFRNYEEVEVKFDSNINCFYGFNGAGKTNLAEAIYYLTYTKSFRSNNDLELIMIGKDYASINAKIKIGENCKFIDVLLSMNGKKILIDNRTIKKLSELNSYFKAIYFIPKDVNLLKDSPKNRRSFLNLSISSQFKEYLSLLSGYNNLLKERNNLLKSENVDLNLLDIYTDQIISSSYRIFMYRKKYIQQINQIINQIYEKITEKSVQINLVYKTFIDLDDNVAYVKKAKDIYKHAIDIDLRNKRSSIGIHLEDFSLLLNGKDLGLYGSQGENRLAVLALKLTPYFLIKEYKDKPIIILDDVLSELDNKKRLNFLKMLDDFPQVFITATEKLNDVKVRNYLIENKNIIMEVKA